MPRVRVRSSHPPTRMVFLWVPITYMNLQTWHSPPDFRTRKTQFPLGLVHCLALLWLKWEENNLKSIWYSAFMENFNLTRGSIYHLIRQISLAIGGKRLVGCTYRGSSLIDNSLSSFPRVFFFWVLLCTIYHLHPKSCLFCMVPFLSQEVGGGS